MRISDLPQSVLPRRNWPALVLLTLLLAGCATGQVGPGRTIANMPVTGSLGAPVRTVVERAAERFAVDLAASANDADNPHKALQAFQSGVGMLDLECQRYLDAVGNANQVSSHERKQVGLVGGFVSAVMGLGGSSAKEIAGVATTFSFAGSSMDAYTTAFLFSDASKSVTKIVRDAQNVYLAEVEPHLGTLQYGEVVRVLTGYEATCRPAQIRALIDDAVARGKVVAEQPGASAEDAEVSALLNTLRVQFGQSFTEAEAIVLYTWLRNPAARAQIAAAVEPVKSLVTRPGGTADLEQKLAVAFLPASIAGSRVPQRWQAAMAQVLKSAAAAAGGANPPAPAAALPAPPGAAGLPAAAVVQPAASTRVLRVPVLTVR